MGKILVVCVLLAISTVQGLPLGENYSWKATYFNVTTTYQVLGQIPDKQLALFDDINLLIDLACDTRYKVVKPGPSGEVEVVLDYRCEDKTNKMDKYMDTVKDFVDTYFMYIAFSALNVILVSLILYFMCQTRADNREFYEILDKINKKKKHLLQASKKSKKENSSTQRKAKVENKYVDLHNCPQFQIYPL